MSPDSYQNHPEWKDFFKASEITAVERLVEEKWIKSCDTQIHLDIYPQKKEAPVVIFCHGLATCGRIMAHIALLLHKKGYNVICPDLHGFGISNQKHGSGTVPTYIQNLKDCIRYAKRRFGSSINLAGISLGGALSYYTACESKNLNAIACYCLMDLSAPETHNVSSIPKLAVKPLIQILSVATKIVPKAHLPLKHMLNIDTMCDYPELIETFKRNPLAVKVYTLKGANSLLTTPPLVKFSNYKGAPTLVLHGTDDRMLPEALSRNSYELLKGFKKYVAILGCEHAPTSPEHLNQFVSEMHSWFKKHKSSKK